MIYKDFYPFYASFANPMLYRGEMELEKEFSLMKSYYPETARKIQEKVEEECDLLDYEGSRMYDEYPDRLQLRLMCRRIYDKAEKEEENPGSWLMDLIEVMTYQELCRRRVEHREIRKKIY